MTDRTIFILSASSDIGRWLMERYLADGATVIGTYRRLGALEKLKDHPRAHLLSLDLNSPRAPEDAATFLRERGLHWDFIIASNGTMEPIGPFMQLDGAAWQATIGANALMPSRIVQALYPLRRPGNINSVAFFAGGGTNNPFRNYSAYCLSKIMLIKMCELLDDEVPDLKVFILGPGYVRTKIHEETLNAADLAGGNRERTLKFFENDGTPMEDIHSCLEWCAAQDRTVVGGRNFSVVHDPWRDSAVLVQELAADPNRYKLRRFGNT